MSKRKPNIKMIGIFSFMGIILFCIIFLFFLRNKITIDKNDLFVMFFKESIQGLKVGSPVVFRGVEIGKVTKIDLIMDKKDFSFDIPVYITIYNNQNKHFSVNKKIFSEILIKNGLRAWLSTYSFITGQLMIEMDIMPNSELILTNKLNNKDIIEVPTILSSKGELSKSLKDLPLKNIIENIDYTLTTLNKEIPLLLKQVNNITNNINKITNIDENKGNTIANNMNEAIINFNDTMKSIKNFVDYLERHPDSLIKGKRGN